MSHDIDALSSSHFRLCFFINLIFFGSNEMHSSLLFCQSVRATIHNHLDEAWRTQMLINITRVKNIAMDSNEKEVLRLIEFILNISEVWMRYFDRSISLGVQRFIGSEASKLKLRLNRDFDAKEGSRLDKEIKEEKKSFWNKCSLGKSSVPDQPNTDAVTGGWVVLKLVVLRAVVVVVRLVGVVAGKVVVVMGGNVGGNTKAVKKRIYQPQPREFHLSSSDHWSLRGDLRITVTVTRMITVETLPWWLNVTMKINVWMMARNPWVAHREQTSRLNWKMM
jgi:hypothetical protein